MRHLHPTLTLRFEALDGSGTRAGIRVALPVVVAKGMPLVGNGIPAPGLCRAFATSRSRRKVPRLHDIPMGWIVTGIKAPAGRRTRTT